MMDAVCEGGVDINMTLKETLLQQAPCVNPATLLTLSTLLYTYFYAMSVFIPFCVYCSA